MRIHHMLYLPILIGTPFLITEVIGAIFSVDGSYTFSKSIFLEEYFKLLGTAIVVLIGAKYAEYLIDLRFNKEKKDTLIQFRGNFETLRKNCIYLLSHNDFDNFNEKEIIVNENRLIIERISWSIKNNFSIVTSISNDDMANISKIANLGTDYQRGSINKPFNSDSLKELILVCGLLTQGGSNE